MLEVRPVRFLLLMRMLIDADLGGIRSRLHFEASGSKKNPTTKPKTGADGKPYLYEGD